MKSPDRVTVVGKSDIRPWMLSYIAFDLRPEDSIEIGSHNIPEGWKLDAALQGAVNASASCLLFFFDGKPALVLGVTPSFNGVYTAWGFGTREAPRVLPLATRVLAKARDIWFASGKAKRVEVRVPVHSAHSINWLAKLGFKIETLIRDYGRDNIDFFQLAITKRDLFKDVPIQSTPTASSGWTSAAEVVH